MLFGAHVKTGGHLPDAVSRGEAMGAEVVQLFSQNSKGWQPTAHPPERLEEFRRRVAASPSVQVSVVHGTYLINLASADPTIYQRSVACLVANLEVATAIGAEGVVVHVGTHRGEGLEARVPLVEAALRTVLRAVPGTARVLIENTAGAGGTIGRSFEELADIVGALDGDERLGVCLDSQHLFASGPGFSTPEEMDGVVRRFDEVVGLDRLRCLHLNDSKVERGSGRDRHENLGAGLIGVEGLSAFLGHPALQGLPVVLETPDTDADALTTARRLHALGVQRYSP